MPRFDVKTLLQSTNHHHQWGGWGHGGSARVSHHCDKGLIPAPCGYVIKITFVTCEKSVVQFVPIKYRRFSPGTPVFSCSNTGPMSGGPYLTFRENTLCC